MDVQRLFQLVCEKYKVPFKELKKEQSEIINKVLMVKNTIGILPTGYGKRFTYILPPLLLDEVNITFRLRYVLKWWGII